MGVAWPWRRKPEGSRAEAAAVPPGAVRYRLRYVGRVQAVGFRFTSEGIAREAGCTGWARNLDDGSVLVEVQGLPEQVAAFERGVARASDDPHTWIRATLVEREPVEPVPEGGFRAVV